MNCETCASFQGTVGRLSRCRSSRIHKGAVVEWTVLRKMPSGDCPFFLAPRKPVSVRDIPKETKKGRRPGWNGGMP